MPEAQVLNVFLASPSDLDPERQAVEESVTEINKLISHLGWHVDLKKWEDSLPGYGSPQTLINPLVDKCDLFVGLLWKKWGTPTRDYSSGFQEEFERARARRKAHGGRKFGCFSNRWILRR